MSSSISTTTWTRKIQTSVIEASCTFKINNCILWNFRLRGNWQLLLFSLANGNFNFSISNFFFRSHIRITTVDQFFIIFNGFQYNICISRTWFDRTQLKVWRFLLLLWSIEASYSTKSDFIINVFMFISVCAWLTSIKKNFRSPFFSYILVI